MSAAWHVRADLSDGRSVEIRWDSRARPTHLGVILLNDVTVARHEFETLGEADRWASSLGVVRWRVAHSARGASPEAVEIPIVFPGAPPDEALDIEIARIEQGAKLREVAARLTAHPMAAKVWLLGRRPTCPALQGWRTNFNG